MSIQAQVLNLLQDLQKEHQLTYMFITHDLSVVKHISDNICVMYLGQVVEQCGAKELFRRTLHPYSQALLSAIPVPRVDDRPERILLQGEIVSPVDPPEQCPVCGPLPLRYRGVPGFCTPTERCGRGTPGGLSSCENQE